MRVLVFGGTGLLGKALVQQWKDDTVTGLGSRDVDIRDESQVMVTIKDIRPEWIVLSAAYTDVDGCETNQQLAFDVNCRGAIHVARAARESNSRLLFVSTDYVFDGTKNSPYETTDPRNPGGVYGRSKAQAEQQLLEILPDCCIVRTSWLFGAGGKCFPDTIIKLASTRPVIEVVDDQKGSPTYTVDLAHAIIDLCRKNARGIIHATNQGECTWFDFARKIVAGTGLQAEVRPTTSEEFVRPAKRPAYSVLSLHSLERLGFQMPNWQDALERYLAERGRDAA